MMDYQLLQGDCIEVLKTLPAASVHCVITSPPYFGLRDYGAPGQIGLEQTPTEYVDKLVQVFREMWRVLRDDGTVWLNLGDSYNGSGGAGGDYGPGGLKEGQPKYPGRRIDALKPKDLIGIPWRVAFALQADGWYLRSDIIWHKPNPMPESVTDRPTKAHEYLFLLTKSERYFYDAQAIAEPSSYPGDERHLRTDTRKEVDPFCADNGSRARTGNPTGLTRNKRSVWTVATKPYTEAHFATYPVELIQPCILAGTSAHGCCSVCGAPWVRQVEREFVPQQDVRDPGKLAKKSNKGLDASNGWGDTPRGTTNTTTLGWQTSCSCGADVVPCTVLDPFNGAATTGVAAIGLGRDYIGIELNPEYIAMSDRRLRNTQPALPGVAP